MILSDGHFTFKNNDILESDRFLYRINIFNGRWLVTVFIALKYLYIVIYIYTSMEIFNTNSMLASVYRRLSVAARAFGDHRAFNSSINIQYIFSIWPRFARQKYIF